MRGALEFGGAFSRTPQESPTTGFSVRPRISEACRECNAKDQPSTTSGTNNRCSLKIASRLQAIAHYNIKSWALSLGVTVSLHGLRSVSDLGTSHSAQCRCFSPFKHGLHPVLGVMEWLSEVIARGVKALSRYRAVGRHHLMELKRDMFCDESTTSAPPKQESSVARRGDQV